MSNQEFWYFISDAVLFGSTYQLANIVHDDVDISVDVPFVALLRVALLEMKSTAVAAMIKRINADAFVGQKLDNTVISVTMLSQAVNNENYTLQLSKFLQNQITRI